MARIAKPERSSRDVLDELEKIRAESGRREVANIHKVLAHSLPLLRAFQPFFNVVRYELELSGRYRELAILRVAQLNRSQSSFDFHIGIACTEGLTQTQIASLQKGDCPNDLDEADREVIAYADAMTKSVVVPDAEFQAILSRFGERVTVELTALIAAYNMQTRFVVALDVETNVREG